MAGDDNAPHMPMTYSREAPRFVRDAHGFDSFFDNVDELGRRCKLSDADRIVWAIRYAGAEADSWKGVPCLAAGVNPAPTLETFREEVREGYPDLDVDRRYTRRDLEALIDRTREYRDMSRGDLGDYYRKFNTYANYLIGKGTLSELDRASSYLRGFPQPVRVEIAARLRITQPHTLPDEGYPFREIHEAARFVLTCGLPGASGGSDATPARADPRDATIDRLLLAVSDLTRVVSSSAQSQQRHSSSGPAPYSRPADPSPTPGGVVQNPPRWGPPPQPTQPSQECMFCSGRDHYVRDCPVAAQYLQQGKVAKNDVGKLVLPDGRYVARSIPGRNMRERIDNLLASSGNQRQDGANHDTVSTHFLEGPDECVFSFDTSDFRRDDTTLEEVQTLEAQIESLREQQVLALQKGGKRPQQFDGVEIPKKVGPPKRDPPPHQVPNIHSRPNANDRSQQPVPTSSGANGKPGVRAGDQALPSRPQGPMRPIEMPPKHSDEPKQRYQAPIEADVKTDDLVDRALDAKITISTRELLATSSEVRKHVKDLVTNKKVSTNLLESDGVDSFITEFLESSDDLDPASVFLDLSKYEPSSPSAVVSLPLRVIYPSFGPGVEPECILDGGAQVVVMRKDIWHQLRAPILPNKVMAIESANAGTTMTIGVLEEHPVQLGPITVYLQIQVVEKAPFEVLLGRPFFDVVSCAEDSRSGGHHQIHVRDPKTGKPYTFPTQPRPRKAIRKSSNAAVNFRQ